LIAGLKSTVSIDENIISGRQEVVLSAQNLMAGPKSTMTIDENEASNSEEVVSSVQNIEKISEAESKYQWLKDIWYNVSGPNSNRAVFVVPRRVYYDNRLERGKPRNTVIIIAEVHDNAVNTIKACELNGRLSKSVKVLKENTVWIRQHRLGHTHCLLVIQCIGLPRDAVFNGSIARVIYKKKGDGYYSRVVSEKQLSLHERSHNPSKPTKGRRSIVVCAITFGHPDRFDQWLMYQQHLGVDRVHLQAHASFIEGAHDYPFLTSSLENGFVQVEIWNDAIVGNRTFYLSQKAKYQDCHNRYIGVFEYMFICDCDDFFNPLLPDKKSIQYYLKRFFSDKTLGSACMHWRHMKCAPRKELVSVVPDGNLTRILSGYKYTKSMAHKCMHRIDAPLMVSVHTVEHLLPGYYGAVTSNSVAYVAHIRRSITKQCKS
jgi:hypothetical protein